MSFVVASRENGYPESTMMEVPLCPTHAGGALVGRWPIPADEAKMLPWYTLCLTTIIVGLVYGVSRKILG